MTGHFEKGAWIEDPPYGHTRYMTDGEALDGITLVCLGDDGKLYPIAVNPETGTIERVR